MGDRRTLGRVIHVLDISTSGLIGVVVIRVVEAVVLGYAMRQVYGEALSVLPHRRFLAYNRHHRRPW
jgi:hypothetical protein